MKGWWCVRMRSRGWRPRPRPRPFGARSSFIHWATGPMMRASSSCSPRYPPSLEQRRDVSCVRAADSPRVPRVGAARRATVRRARSRGIVASACGSVRLLRAGWGGQLTGRLLAGSTPGGRSRDPYRLCSVVNVRSFSEGIRARSAHIRRWLGVGAPRRTCKKLSRGLVSVTLKSSGTILNVAHSVRTLHVFQRSSLGLPEAGGRGRGTDLPIGRMSTLRPGAA